MAEVFNDLSTPALTRVIDDNLIEKSVSFAQFFNGKISGPNPLWFITGPAMLTNNGIARANFSPAAIDEGIHRALMPFEMQNLSLSWWVGPTSTPQNLGYHLQRYGFTHNRDMIGMAVDLLKLEFPENTNPAFVLEYVIDRDTLKEWYNLVLQCFPISYSASYLDALADISLRPDANWLHYVGRIHGNIVAVSSLFIGAGVAGLYNLGTHPKWRCQGLGALTTVKTFHQARDRGYRVGTLQTTYPNALRMYHTMGFEVYCKIGIYRKSNS
ncbi:MAG: GNAT family N-acetyltransferase [Anaerolineae bacterium]|nr:GNAT family N-acetyltransferase [Anaerolineae bacterium]